MSFENFIGQNSIKAFLEKSIKTPFHSYIFSGEKGLGKNTLALIFAKHLICETGTSCGKCKSCRLFENSNHPDIKVIEKEEGKKEISIENIRDIIENIYLGPLISKKKVIIIKNSEDLSISAQNALLKTLEEPPEYVIFILTTNNIEKILPTVISRSIILKFKKYSYDEIEKIIKQKGYDPKDYIIKVSNGNIGNAINYYNNQTNQLRDNVFDMINKYDKKPFDFIKEFETDFSKFEGNLKAFFEYIIFFYRDVIIYKLTENINQIINTDKIDYINYFANRHTIHKLYKYIEDFIEIEKYIDSNVNHENIADSIFLKLTGG
ncbi:ATP-binding protein [Caldicellulosiruptoraceae bacterium PP1]